jgi:hypothetical protein
MGFYTIEYWMGYGWTKKMSGRREVSCVAWERELFMIIILNGKWTVLSNALENTVHFLHYWVLDGIWLDEEDGRKKRGELRGMREKTFYDYNIKWEISNALESTVHFSGIENFRESAVGKFLWFSENLP